MWIISGKEYVLLDFVEIMNLFIIAQRMFFFYHNISFLLPMLLCLILFKRQYEEKQLKAQQERAQRRLEFSNQESRLMNQVSR